MSINIDSPRTGLLLPERDISPSFQFIIVKELVNCFTILNTVCQYCIKFIIINCLFYFQRASGFLSCILITNIKTKMINVKSKNKKN